MQKNYSDGSERLDQARIDRLALQIAKDDYSFYVDYTHRGIWLPARHNDLICQRVEAVERGDITRLMIFMPPRHGKSMTISETFPSWFIGKDPNRRVIEASYGDSLAKKFGGANKKKVEAFGKDIFNIRIDRNVAMKTNWNIDGYRGGMISAGIGGSITGEGADLLIIDDPIKNRKEAESDTYRSMVWDEWQNTLLTRLHPGGRVIIILTRWHEQDLAGKLLKEEGQVEEGGKWHVLSLPAVAEANDPMGRDEGEPLWPEHGYDLVWAEDMKKAVGSYTWASLYQQQPRPRDEARMLRREWFKIVPDWPRDAKGVRFWDLAATEAKKGKDPDFTAGAFVVEKNGLYWIVDIRRTRTSPLGVENLVKQTAETDSKKVHIWMEQEPGSSGVNNIDHYRRNVLKGYTFRGVLATGSKELRAYPLSAAAEAGNVFLVKGAWNKDFLDEVDVFGTGAAEHDDQVDGVSGAFEALNKKIDFFTGSTGLF